MQVRATQGDTIDSLCNRHLGSSAQVEAVIELNQGIAALGPVIPNGTLVTLPDITIETSPSTITINIQLWD